MLNIKTIKEDEQFLRQESLDVKFDDLELDNNIKYLFDYCKNKQLFALASIQIGIPKKIIYIKCTEPSKVEDVNHNEKIIMLNPKIIEQKGETYFWEACASCLDNTCYVKRPYEITVEYFDKNFEYQKSNFKGFIATVISHEYDHLFGMLHMDFAEKTLKLSKEERKILREKEPYKIIDKHCIYDRKV
ncbi:MAG: peptide deformylase [Bacilli bacterium]|nr:peptide deformylase [Bacilli bacterium]